MDRWSNLAVYEKLALDCALETGALRKCPEHNDVILSQHDRDPQPSINALALLVSRAQAEGFEGDENSHLQTDLIFVLQSADEFCPQCQKNDNTSS